MGGALRSHKLSEFRMHEVTGPLARVLRARFSPILWTLIAIAGPVQAQDPSADSCPDEAQEGGRLRGFVRDEASDVPLPGARILVAHDAREATPENAAWEARADQEGFYEICDLPLDIRLKAWAVFRDIDGKVRRLELRPAGPRVDLEVSLGEPAYLLFSVLEAGTDRPIRGASIVLGPLRLLSLTDSAGRAAFSRVPPGQYQLEVGHIAYASVVDSLRVAEDTSAELEVRLATRVLELEPIRVTVTGRDPYLVQRGFYDRMNSSTENLSFFYEKEVVEPYRLLSTFFRFKKEFVVFGGPTLIIVDGRPWRRLGYRRIDEIPLHRIRGIEYLECRDMPARVWALIPIQDVPFGDCRVIMIWTR